MPPNVIPYHQHITTRRNRVLANPQTTAAERQAIARYTARWDRSARPQNPTGIEEIRARLWRQINGVPKCYKCFRGREAMPGMPRGPGTVLDLTMLPIGLDPIDLVPCSCAWEEAIVKEYLVAKDIWPADPLPGPSNYMLLDGLIGISRAPNALIDRNVRITEVQRDIQAHGPDAGIETDEI
ncbi:uncharacterized protein BDZ99DRAFT_478991 [Mytilinidion resinicola]|uniref:Uncharacterized protein n=1 Tax=Mytilinidion resinicola TaxID=574789 RepID=A0A6A6YFF7_9PEZI|nr:uncharacterized protein BDZ99DRAFT_478991 [Mytilinidion resinicola]KAF2807531.1 hypothetical protein BDZ99DRAFT_478991 [Mytilinidion resinicola]